MIGGLQGENGDLDIKYLKQKNLKMSVATIGKLQEKFRRRTKWLRNFADEQDGCEIISQPKADFSACQIGLQLGVIGFQWL